MLIVAHTGHWALWILYALPVLIVVGSIVVSVVRQRRENAAEGGDAAVADGE